MREAQRTAPSIIYIPHIHLWWEAVATTLKATFTMLLQNIPTFAPVLLLATADVHHEDLPKEVFLSILFFTFLFNFLLIYKSFKQWSTVHS